MSPVSPPDCLAQIPSVSFISLSFILWETFNLNRHISCKHHEISVFPHQKEVESLPKVKPKHASFMGLKYVSSICWQHSSKTRRFRETNTHLGGHSHLHENYVNLRPSQKKSSPLTTSLLVLNLKFFFTLSTYIIGACF